MKKLKSIVSLSLALTVTANYLSVIGAAGAEEKEHITKYPYVVFAADEQSGISLKLDSLTLNGNGFTNGLLSNTAQAGNMNGEIIEAEKSKELSDEEIEAFDVNKDMIYIHNKLTASYFSKDCQNYNDDITFSDMNNNINTPVYVVGKINIEGNLALNSAIGAVSDITVSNGNVNGNNTVIYSKFGNIKIDSEQVSVDGLIYAPFGNVIINCSDFNTNGLIIAQNVFINGSVANINYNERVAEFVGTATETLTWAKSDYKYLADTDEDNLPDIIEKGVYNTDPFNPDTDEDGLPDGFEALSTGTNPKIVDSDDNGVLDRDEDFDKDGLTNVDEYINSTNPLYEDTDKDKLCDGEEVSFYFTNPLVMDTDSDGLDDYDEVLFNSDPNNYDSDGNGIPDGAEKRFQVMTYESENPDSTVKSVTVSINATGNIDRTTRIRDIMNTDMMCTNVVGLVGEPYSIKTDSEFDKATITFSIDQTKLGDTDFNNLMFLWHDVDNHKFVELETVLDADNSTVSVETTHFSKYMIVDKEKWFEAWAKRFNYNPNQDHIEAPVVKYNTVLAIDCSGSMDSNDPINDSCKRIEAAEGFVNNMNSIDKAAIILFDNYAYINQGLTDDRNALLESINNIYSSGGTNFDEAITKAITVLEPFAFQNQTTNRILLLSDGESYYDESVLDNANRKQINIYTVGLGSYSNDYVLQEIAEYTGGEFYKAFTADELVDIYKEFGISDDFDTTDTDGDGLYDAVETAGIRLENGNIIYTDPTSVDTDGDGLEDGEEIDPNIQCGQNREYYFIMYSDPSDLEFDSDKDGLFDYEENIFGTDPYVKDSDDDRLDDGLEHLIWFDPLDPNPDGDAFDDHEEFIDHGDPYMYDLTTGEWLEQFGEGALFGDFIEDQTVPQLLGSITSNVIPYVGTVADIRDTIGNAVNGHWGMAALSLLGVVPAIGDYSEAASSIAHFITKNIDNTDEIADLLISLSKNFPDDFARLVPNSQLDEVAEAFKTNNHMSHSTYDELVKIFEKAGKKLSTVADEFPEARKVVSNEDVWNITSAQRRGFAIDELLNNNLGRTYPTYDHFDLVNSIATSVKSIDPMCKSYQVESKFRGLLNTYKRHLLRGASEVTFNGTNYKIKKRCLELVFPNVPFTSMQKEVLNQFISDNDTFDIIITIIE